MAACRISNGLPVKKINNNVTVGDHKLNLSTLPNYPPADPFQSMEHCRGTLCSSIGECVPNGFEKFDQKVSMPPKVDVSTKTEDECLDACRFKKECRGVFFDNSTGDCHTATNSVQSVQADSSSTVDLFLRRPL